ncbi:MAG: CzcE family metal-binding protein [Thiomonas sp.]
MNKFSALLAIAGLATAVSAQAAIPTRLFGNTVPDSAASRVVAITPSTDSINAQWGRSIEFKDHGKSFAYEFDGPRADARVNLERVAPAGMINHPVYAYVGGFPVN